MEAVMVQSKQAALSSQWALYRVWQCCVCLRRPDKFNQDLHKVERVCSVSQSNWLPVYEAFSVHNKAARYTVRSAEEAIGFVKQSRDMLDQNTSDIQGATGI